MPRSSVADQNRSSSGVGKPPAAGEGIERDTLVTKLGAMLELLHRVFDAGGWDDPVGEQPIGCERHVLFGEVLVVRVHQGEVQLVVLRIPE